MASRRSRSGRAAADAFNRIRSWLLGRTGRDALPLVLLGAVGLTLLVVFGLQSRPEPSLTPPQAALAPSDTVTETEPSTPEPADTADTPDSDAELELAAIDLVGEPDWRSVQVARGDTLALIFDRLGLSAALVHRVATLDEHGKHLTRLRPGDELAFDLDEEGAFRGLRAEFDDEHWLYVEAGPDEQLTSRIEPRTLDTRIVEVEAEISSSLFNAGKNVGLSDNMILRLAGIFGWDIDFALDIRRGDRFALVYEEIYRDGEFLRQGPILAARFINEGRSFAAVRFDAGNGPDFYDPDGRPMRKAFLRAPLNFTRVTSNFNPRRFHPVMRTVRPHNGTDYGAPTGTPVWAAGDGTVIEAAYGPANGNYIFIQHGNHIVTRYLHLSKKHVKRGDRVRQGQTIGLVGATGLASGPHLHYEFLVNGRHRDPRTVELPVAEPLSPELLPAFRAATAPLLTRLEDLLPPSRMLAARDAETAAGSAAPAAPALSE